MSQVNIGLFMWTVLNNHELDRLFAEPTLNKVVMTIIFNKGAFKTDGKFFKTIKQRNPAKCEWKIRFIYQF